MMCWIARWKRLQAHHSHNSIQQQFNEFLAPIQEPEMISALARCGELELALWVPNTHDARTRAEFTCLRSELDAITLQQHRHSLTGCLLARTRRV